MEVQEYLNSVLEKSMLISEKKKYYNGNLTKTNIECLENWKQQKNLVDQKVLKLILDKENMSEDEFAYSISPIHLSKYEEPEWLKLLDKVLNEFEEEKLQDIENIDISIIIFPFIAYVGDIICNFDWGDSNIGLSEEALKDVLENYMIQIISFFEKCIVIELNEYKQKNKFKTDDKKNQFEEFLKKRFVTKENYLDFYEKYAVSSRLASVRTLYFIHNIKDFFENLIDSADSIAKKLNIKVGEIKNLGLSVGDSHEKGKEVIIIKFENEQLVYKPKNLDICKSFTDFVNFMNKDLCELEFKTPKGIYKENYAFIEFIEHKSCLNEKQVQNFYERFGYTLALGYFLSITDLHLENIIAYGEYPMIVDGETMMQNSIKFYENESVITRFQEKFLVETILATALLPNTVKIDNNLELSGLSGDEQKSQKKYLTAVNAGTSDFHFEEREYTMSAASNIPMINGKKVNYKKYRNYIISGFLKIMSYFNDNKERFTLAKKSPLEVFKDKKIRFLAKNTQSYGTMFTYLNHPDCCRKMVIRERILQNIWAYPHLNKNIIKSEYRDMLFNDIPIFYSNTNSCDLYDSYGNVFCSYFDNTGFQKVIDRIKAFDKKQLRIQTDLLYLHLGIYDDYKRTEFSRREYTFSNTKINYLAEAEKMGDKIISQADEDSFQNIGWEYIKIGEENTNFGITGLDLYDGISGIALFFLELYKVSNKKKYYDYYHKCMKSCLKDFKYFDDEYSLYCSKYSVLWPIMVELKWSGTSEYEELIHSAIKNFEGKKKKDIENSKNFCIDWINGISGLLVLLLEMIEHISCLSDNEKIILEKFTKELKEVILERVNNSFEGIGQAHGYSGIMLSLARYTKVICKQKKDEVEKIIISCLKKEMKMYEEEKVERKDKWCHGLSGMILSRMEIDRFIQHEEVKQELKVLVNELVECQEDMFVGDSLCHGNAGTIYILEYLIDNNMDTTGELQDILDKMLCQMCGESFYQKYRLLSTQCVTNPGLFNGYAGVGFMYLRILDKSVSNVLTLIL